MVFKLYKNPLLWFLFLPVLVIGSISFLIPLHHSALLNILLKKEAQQERVNAVRSHVRLLEGAVLISPEEQAQLQTLKGELKQEVERLAYYTNEVGEGIWDTIKRQRRQGTGEAM
jgi:hypothetical protein